MKLEIARGLFLVGALGVTAMAAAAWQESTPMIIDSQTSSALYCPQPLALRKKPVEQVRPDSDLLLFLFGMTRGVSSRN
ncbi:hypothetical protein [Aquipseudomonas campi]